jgi:hypothetical protein
MSMLPPPRVGGTELAVGAVNSGSCEYATPIIPMNVCSGKRTLASP